MVFDSAFCVIALWISQTKIAKNTNPLECLTKKIIISMYDVHYGCFLFLSICVVFGGGFSGG